MNDLFCKKTKKKADFSREEFFTYDERLCVQCMHIGRCNNEPATVELMHEYMRSCSCGKKPGSSAGTEA